MSANIGLNREIVILNHNLEVLQTMFFFKLDISAAKYQKRSFNILCILLPFIIHLNIFLVFACTLCILAC